MGVVILPRDKCPGNRQLKMSLEFWEDGQAEDRLESGHCEIMGVNKLELGDKRRK